MNPPDDAALACALDGAPLARALHDAAVAGADAAAATRHALARTPLDGARIWLVAAGKAAVPMARAGVAALREHGCMLADGLVVAPIVAPVDDAISVLAGDHPVPGTRSAAAARALGALVARVADDDLLLVLLSGGATALLGAPVAGVDERDYAQLVVRLLRSGADIGVMNALRKRVSRWGAGRLAAAVPGRVCCLAVSDVAGDDLATIGSGPCTADAMTAGALRDLVAREGLTDVLPPSVTRYVDAVARGERDETPKPHEAFAARVTAHVILSNRDALDAAERAAERHGAEVVREAGELRGAAAAAGRACARRLLALAAARREAGARSALCVLWGGETTVALSPDASGRGGRCQELALAAAELLGGVGGAARGVTLLAAGTDGVDGPTDAAGAVVDDLTWTRIESAGVDPVTALAAHDAYPALDAAGALLRTGPTGTNVRDVVIGVVSR